MPRLEMYGCWIQPVDLHRGMKETYVVMAKCSPENCHTMRMLISGEELDKVNFDLLDQIYHQTVVKFNGLRHG